jgi:hypothetical protein
MHACNCRVMVSGMIPALEIGRDICFFFPTFLFSFTIVFYVGDLASFTRPSFSAVLRFPQQSGAIRIRP